MSLAHEDPLLSRAPEYLGEGMNRRDITHWTDRQIAISAHNDVIRVGDAVRTLTNKLNEFLAQDEKKMLILLNELPNVQNRLTALEVTREQQIEARVVQALRPAAVPEPHRPAAVTAEWEPEESSYHNLEEIMKQSAQVLYHRAKDPKDRMTSDRVREVAKTIFESAKNAEDAAAFRSLKKTSRELFFTGAKSAAKVIGAAVVGFILAYFGFRQAAAPKPLPAAVAPPPGGR